MTIYIQSSSDDISTNEVIEWLYYFGHNYILRINDQHIINHINFEISNTMQQLEINQTKIDGEFLYWYRRGNFVLNPKLYGMINDNNFKEQLSLFNYQKKEINDVIKFISQDFIYKEGKSINKIQENDTNKISNLYLAKHCNINIPHTKVISNKDTLLEFAAHHTKIITKPIKFHYFNVKSNAKLLDVFYLTKVLNLKRLTKIFDKLTNCIVFCPTLFQEYVEKKYEIRVFFLNGKLYPMCIFSQSNIKTKYDFRHYDFVRPNRLVPYNFENTFQRKLLNFINKLSMKSGSIDIIVNKNNEYYFLEVNPIGQFQWLSKACNYFLEKQIAKYYYEQK